MTQTAAESRLIEFSRQNPLPRSTEAMAEALLDLAVLFFCRNDLPMDGELDLTLIYRDGTSAHPGAFLSNPAVLPSTRSPCSTGSFGCGFMFAYAHSQEDTLGPAPLLCAASPRTIRPGASPRLYAKALLLLLARGDASRVSSGFEGQAKLQAVADGSIPRGELRRWSFGYGFDAAAAEHLHARGLVLPRSAACVSLGLEEPDPNVFDQTSREKMSNWAAGARAMGEAASIESSSRRSGLTRPLRPRL